jgi:hypothetical protein
MEDDKRQFLCLALCVCMRRLNGSLARHAIPSLAAVQNHATASASAQRCTAADFLHLVSKLVTIIMDSRVVRTFRAR